MCRFLVYAGPPVAMAELVTRPEHSILRQSFDSRERKEPSSLPSQLNADGFGVGWFAAERTAAPCVFVSTLPAWNNLNLIRLCESIEAPLVFAHVRAASPRSGVAESNCHPFAFGRFLFMHNGHVGGFGAVRRKMLMGLAEDAFAMIQGSTDSEHAFAVFLTELLGEVGSAVDLDKVEIAPQQLLQILMRCIRRIIALGRECGVSEASFLNFAVTDGQTVAVSRIIDLPEGQSSDRRAASLYFSSGTAFKKNQDGNYRMEQRDRREEVVMVASERITSAKEDWVEVPQNHILFITAAKNVLLVPFSM